MDLGVALQGDALRQRLESFPGSYLTQRPGYMTSDERVFILGEDVGLYGGAFKVTDGFSKRFGESRVIDTPISEAAIVGAAIAMGPDDWIVPQYREPGAALVRGMPLTELLCQLMGNAADPVKGHQMPCHYVYRKGNYLSISSPVGTQLPHAVGIGWAMRLRGDPTAQ